MGNTSGERPHRTGLGTKITCDLASFLQNEKENIVPALVRGRKRRSFLSFLFLSFSSESLDTVLLCVTHPANPAISIAPHMSRRRPAGPAIAYMRAWFQPYANPHIFTYIGTCVKKYLGNYHEIPYKPVENFSIGTIENYGHKISYILWSLINQTT